MTIQSLWIIMMTSCFYFHILPGNDADFYLPTPQPNDKQEFISCYNEMKDVYIKWAMRHIINQTTKSRRRYQYKNSRSINPFGVDKTNCENHRLSYLWKQPAGKRLFLKVRITQNKDSSTYGLDSYHAIPTNFLGKSYSISNGNSRYDRRSYVAIINVIGTKAINVTVSFDPYTEGKGILVDKTAAKGKKATVIIPQKSIKYLTTVDATIDGVRLYSLDYFAVLSGSVTTQNSPGKNVNHLVEMFPPECVFSTEYVLPYFPNWFNNTMVNIQSLSNSPQKAHSSQTPPNNPSTLSIPLDSRGFVFPIFQEAVLHLRAQKPIMVVQVLYNSIYATAMVVIPPVREWTSSALLYPMKTRNSGNDKNTIHFALVTIKESDANRIRIVKLGVGDVTRSVTFSQVPRSTFSQSYIKLSINDRYLLEHPSAGFQVIQYGWQKDAGVVYASPVSYNFTGCHTPLFDLSPQGSLPNNIGSTDKEENGRGSPGWGNDWGDEGDDNGDDNNGDDDDYHDNDDGSLDNTIIVGLLLSAVGLVAACLLAAAIWACRRRRKSTIADTNADNTSIETTVINENETSLNLPEGESIVDNDDEYSIFESGSTVDP